MSTNATSTVPVALPSVSSLDKAFGGVLIATFIGLMYVQFREQRMVSSRRLLDAGNVVVTMHAYYHYLVTNYFNPSALLGGVWRASSCISVSTMLSGYIPCLFSNCISTVGSRYRYAAILAAMCALGGFGMLQSFSTADILLTGRYQALEQVRRDICSGTRA
ncbi:hypothetical protein BD309DRAFT_1026644 [Dichomitus squalens]|nr:hypothetical protein BD309DRAFT_1026644 [Dichomitus squalens]